MERPLNLVLAVPPGVAIATSLGLEGLAWHRSPGSGKYFKGRSLFVDLALEGGRPVFQFLDEGGWRDPTSDTLQALEGAAAGKRTKTALSNGAFNCVPLSAFRRVLLVKTGGEVAELEAPEPLASFSPAARVHEKMAPDEIAAAVGLLAPRERTPRIYMVLAPVELILLSNLSPVEYAWYATRRPGKLFRQLLFTELKEEQSQLAAEAVYQQARGELARDLTKKTKTVVLGDCINRVPYQAWTGYYRRNPGGLYAGDARALSLWRFPEQIPRAFEKATG